VATDAVRLAGVHHLKLPVRDIASSEAWYGRTLGYRRTVEFRDGEKLMGILMDHPDGGPPLALRLDPDRAQAAAGFDYFIIGVPDHATIDELAAHLDALGERHGGVHRAGIGWILPFLHDPDGHEVRFYTMEHHTSSDADDVKRFDDPDELRRLRERVERTTTNTSG
jgi:catechol 2,3-dioxygenase-like lactoylglutathione lyase family enzyme